MAHEDTESATQARNVIRRKSVPNTSTKKYPSETQPRPPRETPDDFHPESRTEVLASDRDPGVPQELPLGTGTGWEDIATRFGNSLANYFDLQTLHDLLK